MRVFAVSLALSCKMVVVLALLFTLVVTSTVFAAPWNYDSASKDVKEYIVDCVTNCVGRTDILLVHSRRDDSLREEDFSISCRHVVSLGLDHFRCVDVLMGDASIGGYKMIYVYRIPRLARMSGGRDFPEFPDLWYQRGGPDGSGVRKFYIQDGKQHYVEGKEIWRFSPPYSPFYFLRTEEYVELCFMSPVHQLKKTRIYRRFYLEDVDKSLHDYNSIPTETLMSRLGVTEAFSNRVYQAEEGCAFQVDYPVPDLGWKDTLITKERHEEIVRSSREEDNRIMHLSPDEASEIVYLSYLADKRYTAADYVAACKRCPKLLKHVKAFKTEIGRRLKAAMEASGMLPKK